MDYMLENLKSGYESKGTISPKSIGDKVQVESKPVIKSRKKETLIPPSEESKIVDDSDTGSVINVREEQNRRQN